MSFATTAAVVTAASAAAAAGYTISQGGGGQPGMPSFGASSREGFEADRDTLGSRRRIDAAARKGTELLKEGYKITYGGDVAQLKGLAEARIQQLMASERQLLEDLAQAKVSRQLRSNAMGPDQPRVDALEAQLTSLRQDLRKAQNGLDSVLQNKGEAIYTDPAGNVVAHDDALDEDFTGLGDADVQSAYARQMAEAILKDQQELGPEFIKTAREQLKLADPEGFAAREQLYAEILAQMGRTQEEPIADSLEAQILAELNAGADTDTQANREIEQALTGVQTERGGGYGKADEYQQAMSQGLAGEARRAQRQQKAAAFLSGGYSKKDRDYKKSQQDMANLAAFLTGQSPTAQFQQLSGAQGGATPFVMSAPGAVTNPNAGAQAAAFNQGNYNTQMNNQPANPWLAGLGLGGQAAGAIATLGGPQGFGWWGGQKTPATNPGQVWGYEGQP